MRRVLRPPHGKLFVLEFSQPKRWFRPCYYFYLRRVLPRLAGLITGDRAAYEYLGQTINEFPEPTSLSAEIRETGFSAVAATRMFWHTAPADNSCSHTGILCSSRAAEMTPITTGARRKRSRYCRSARLRRFHRWRSRPPRPGTGRRDPALTPRTSSCHRDLASPARCCDSPCAG